MTSIITRHLSDHHAVQGEAEYVERHAPEIGRDAPAMAQVPPLKWRSAGYDGQILDASALGLEVFYRVHGQPGGWTLTSPGAREYVHTPGYETRADAQAAAQADYERRILAALTPAPQPEGQQIRENDDACEALARAYDREDAAQRGETDPWSIGIDDDPEWVADRIACARAGLAALTASPGWQPIETAPRDGTFILAYTKAALEERWMGMANRPFAIKHMGRTTASGLDLGWSLFPGMGVGDDWFVGWMPLPAAPEAEGGSDDL